MKTLMDEINKGNIEGVVVVREKEVEEKRVNTNFTLNSPKKGKEIQYYTDKKEPNSQFFPYYQRNTPLFDFQDDISKPVSTK